MKSKLNSENDFEKNEIDCNCSQKSCFDDLKNWQAKQLIMYFVINFFILSMNTDLLKQFINAMNSVMRVLIMFVFKKCFLTFFKNAYFIEIRFIFYVQQICFEIQSVDLIFYERIFFIVFRFFNLICFNLICQFFHHFNKNSIDEKFIRNSFQQIFFIGNYVDRKRDFVEFTKQF